MLDPGNICFPDRQSKTSYVSPPCILIQIGQCYLELRQTLWSQSHERIIQMTIQILAFTWLPLYSSAMCVSVFVFVCVRERENLSSFIWLRKATPSYQLGFSLFSAGFLVKPYLLFQDPICFYFVFLHFNKAFKTFFFFLMKMYALLHISSHQMCKILTIHKYSR